MAMIQIKGILTQDGKIEVELPDGWQPGEVNVEINIEPAWSNEEVNEILNFEGKSLGDIDPSLLGAGADWEIGDSAEWVEKQREKRRKKWMD